jgi:ubiquinone/menaquinone biosynthesis C-methylase UbiE
MVQDPGNLKRFEGTVRLVPQDVRNLIDVGCGNGVFARMVKRRFPSIHITCVDRSAAAPEHVEADEKNALRDCRLPFDDRSFDCISCLAVIEHLTVRD